MRGVGYLQCATSSMNGQDHFDPMVEVFPPEISRTLYMLFTCLEFSTHLSTSIQNIPTCVQICTCIQILPTRMCKSDLECLCGQRLPEASLARIVWRSLESSSNFALFVDLFGSLAGIEALDFAGRDRVLCSWFGPDMSRVRSSILPQRFVTGLKFPQATRAAFRQLQGNVAK